MPRDLRCICVCDSAQDRPTVTFSLSLSHTHILVVEREISAWWAAVAEERQRARVARRSVDNPRADELRGRRRTTSKVRGGRQPRGMEAFKLAEVASEKYALQARDTSIDFYLLCIHYTIRIMYYGLGMFCVQEIVFFLCTVGGQEIWTCNIVFKLELYTIL